MRFCFLAFAVAAIAAPAMAQDTPSGHDHALFGPGGDYSFTGLRAEVLGGYIRELPDVRTDGPVFTTSVAQKHSGGSAGVQGGYDYQLGPVVVGVFGGYALVTSQGCGTIGGLNQGCLRPEAEAEGGARVGLQVRGRFLAYAKGSYVNTRFNTSTLSGQSVVNSHINQDGYRVGGGGEFALTRRVYIKAEYDYSRPQRIDGALYGFQSTSIHYHDHSVLGGFGLRF